MAFKKEGTETIENKPRGTTVDHGQYEKTPKEQSQAEILLFFYCVSLSALVFT